MQSDSCSCWLHGARDSLWEKSSTNVPDLSEQPSLSPSIQDNVFPNFSRIDVSLDLEWSHLHRLHTVKSSYTRSVPCIVFQMHNQVQNASARWQKKCSIKLHGVPSVVQGRDNSIYSFGVTTDCFGQILCTAEFYLLRKVLQIHSAALQSFALTKNITK